MKLHGIFQGNINMLKILKFVINQTWQKASLNEEDFPNRDINQVVEMQ